MRRGITAIIMSGAIGVSMGVALGQDDIIAVSWSGDVYTIDSSTGSGSLLNGSRTFINLNASAKSPSGEIYTTSNNTLVRVDETTGAMTSVATMSISSIRGMDFAPDGTLYAYNDEGFGTPDVFYSIDANTGATTRLGTANDTGIQGFAIDSQGNAYAWDIFNGLATVNLANGATADLSGAGNTDIQAIAFDLNDELFGCREALYSISTVDGSFTTIGSGGHPDTRGFEFIGGAGGYRLNVGGQCPGTVTVSWSGANAGRQQGLVFGAQQGSTIIPSGVCQGTMLGIQGSVRLINNFGTGNGSGMVSGSAGTGACGGWLQLVEVPGCAVSNPDQIPN